MPLIECGKKAAKVVSDYIICSPHLGPRPDGDSPEYLRNEIKAYELVEPLAALAIIYANDTAGRINMRNSQDSAKSTKDSLQERLDRWTQVEAPAV